MGWQPRTCQRNRWHLFAVEAVKRPKSRPDIIKLGSGCSKSNVASLGVSWEWQSGEYDSLVAGVVGSERTTTHGRDAGLHRLLQARSGRWRRGYRACGHHPERQRGRQKPHLSGQSQLPPLPLTSRCAFLVSFSALIIGQIATPFTNR